VIVRPATTTDVVVIASLLNALVASTTIEWTDAPQTMNTVLKWLDEHETELVADEDGEVVGVAAYGWFRDVVKRPGYRFTVENTIHVREGSWRLGVGHSLMRALIEDARSRGMHTMVAAVDGANEASIRFHQRLGFVEVARMRELGAKFGRWLDLVLLQLRLDDRPAPSDALDPPSASRHGMLQFVIRVDDPRAPDVCELLDAHLAFSHLVTPPGHVHALDADTLVDAAVTFYAARRDGMLLGVGALKELDPSHGEVKSMHTVEAARRQGVGRAMVEHLVAVAADRGYASVSLETGKMTAFAPARTMYENIGFARCEPFGDYTANPNSICMSLVLDVADPADVQD
jgi:putative acetyltransferase